MVSEQNKAIIKELLKSDLRDIYVLRDLLSMAMEIESEDRKQSRKLAEKARDCAMKACSGRNGKKAFELYNQALLYLAKNYKDFDSYLLYVEKNRDPEERFYQPRRNQLHFIVREMQRMIDDELDLLTISVVPGAGKTTLEEFFASFVMGLYPNKPNIFSSFSSYVTDMFYDAVLNIIVNKEYCWSDVFPDVPLEDKDAKATTINLGKFKPFKTLTCRAINASVTGVTRAEGFVFVDDLVSGIEEALSKDRLDLLYNKYVSNLKTRRKKGCKEIHIATRWSVHDVIGRLQRQYDGDPRASFIAVPDIDPVTGKSNFNYDYGVGFDEKYFLDIAATMDDVTYRCLYKNEPVEREGLLYHPDELRRYLSLPDREPDAILAVCDTKDIGKDYNCLQVYYQYGNDHYLVDTVYKNIDPGTLDELNANMLVAHNVQRCQFESNKEGSRTAAKVMELVKAKGGRCNITKKYSTQNKETKIIVNSAWVKEHVLFKDPSMYTLRDDYGKMMSNICQYTQMGKNASDDGADALSMYALFTTQELGAKVTVTSRALLGF